MVKKFQGSWGIFIILLICGIIPAMIYWAVKYEEVTPIQQPAAPQPTVQQKRFCSECGTEVTEKFCNKCGTEIK